MEKGVFSSALIKKRKHWPTLIKGSKIDSEMVCYEIGKTASIKGTLDNIRYNIFCLKEELDYVCKLMATYNGFCPPNCERKGTTRTRGDESVVKLYHERPWANHFDFRHCIDSNNNLRHSKPSLEKTLQTARWEI